MESEERITGEAMAVPPPQALIALRNLLARCRYEDIEEIPVLPTPIQVICMLILNRVRRAQGAYEPVYVDDNLPIHPVYARFFLITRRQASLLWRLFALGRPVALKRLRNWVEDEELAVMLEGGVIKMEGRDIRSRYLVTSASGTFVFTTFLRRSGQGFELTTGNSDIYELESAGEGSLHEQALEMALDLLLEALRNPRIALFRVLQRIHCGRLAKKRAREEQLFRRAVRQLGEHNLERAEYNLRRVLELNGDNQAARRHLAGLLRETGRAQER